MITIQEAEVKNEKKKKFNKFFSNVSLLTVADTTPEMTQIVLVNALKEVGN